MKLPEMTSGNWFFWGVLTFIGINFLWLGLLEQFLPLWLGAVIGFIVFLLLFIYGPRVREEEEQ
jgi:predicted small integral membrane protein